MQYTSTRQALGKTSLLVIYVRIIDCETCYDLHVHDTRVSQKEDMMYDDTEERLTVNMML